jgi:S1-C subfamily serine protease
MPKIPRMPNIPRIPIPNIPRRRPRPARSEATDTGTAVTYDVSGRLRPWRKYLIPRSVLGLTALLLSFAIGASLSGVVLYSYYEYRLTNVDKKMNNYITGFDQRFRTASDTIDAEKQNAQASVQKELEPLRQFQAEGGTQASLVQKIRDSVYFVQTVDANGAPSVGTAFVVQSDDKNSLMVTSYTTVKAATRAPGPDVFVTKGNDKIKATLNNWVEDQDLAVLTVPRGNLPKLDFVPSNQIPRVGERTFVASGLAAAGASVTQGFISDVSQTAMQYDAGISEAFQGGPLINSNGQVTGVASTTFAPFGFPSSGGVSFAIPIRETCDKLLRCPADNSSVTGAGTR